MKAKLFFFFLLVLSCVISKAQIICIFCYEQNDSISSNVNNLLLNGSFESSSCTPGYTVEMFCPNSIFYSCDVADWTCTGGGDYTYACIFDSLPGSRSTLVDGNRAVYLGNALCNPCSAATDDTSCIVPSGCELATLPVGFPTNDPLYGGSTGVSIEQQVNGLVPGSIYILEFWAGGESNGNTFLNPGMFAVDVGFGNTLLRCHQTPYGTGVGTRYIIEFRAVSASQVVRFTNWGHICSSCTEVVIDQVRLYTLAELSPGVQSCSGLSALFTAPNQICPGTCTDFTNYSQSATSYQWFFPGAIPSSSTDVNPSNICYNTPGNYDVQLIASNSQTSDTLALNNYITVYPSPPPQGINQSGDTLIANQGAVSYQWYYSGTMITGATTYLYIATMSGDYNVVATDNNGCEVEAAIFDVIAEVQDVEGGAEASIHPNPAENSIGISSVRGFRITGISIMTIFGEKVLNIPNSGFNSAITVNVQALPPGIYYAEIYFGEKSVRAKFIKSSCR